MHVRCDVESGSPLGWTYVLLSFVDVRHTGLVHLRLFTFDLLIPPSLPCVLSWQCINGLFVLIIRPMALLPFPSVYIALLNASLLTHIVTLESYSMTLLVHGR